MFRTSHPADDVLVAPAAPRRSARADAVTLLTILLAVRLVLPSQFVVGALGGAGAPATLLGLVLLAYWLWHRLHRTQIQKGAAVNAVAIAFLGVLLASDVVAASRPIQAEELNLSTLSLISVGGWMGGLLLASDGVSTIGRLRAIVSRLAVLGAAFGGFGLFQFVTAAAWIDKLSIPGLVLNTPVYAITQRDGFIRPFSTAIHPIEFGSVIAMLLPLTIVFGLLGSRSGRMRWWSWIPALMIVLAGSLSSSRSTFVGIAVGVLFLWPALKRTQRVVGAVAALGVGAFVFVTVPGMVSTITSLFAGVVSGDSSVASRVDGFAVAASYISRSPIIGRGFGTFLPRYWIFDDQYLLNLVETGAVGLIFMLLLWIVPVVAVARVLRRTEPGSPERLLGTGLLASSIVGGVGLAFFDGFGFPMMPAVWFVVLGLAGAYVRLARATAS